MMGFVFIYQLPKILEPKSNVLNWEAILIS